MRRTGRYIQDSAVDPVIRERRDIMVNSYSSMGIVGTDVLAIHGNPAWPCTLELRNGVVVSLTDSTRIWQ